MEPQPGSLEKAEWVQHLDRAARSPWGLCPGRREDGWRWEEDTKSFRVFVHPGALCYQNEVNREKWGRCDSWDSPRARSQGGDACVGRGKSRWGLYPW